MSLMIRPSHISAKSITNKLYLKKIADNLMFHGNFNVIPGLMKGQMGIIIFMYHFSRFSQNKLYSNYADDLLDSVISNISKLDPLNFANGMTGIGWGIEYLEQNAFVEANTDEILEEVDKKICDSLVFDNFEKLPNDIFFGKALYFLSRLKNREKEKKNKTVQNIKQQLVILTNACEIVLSLSQEKNWGLKATDFRYFLSTLFYLQEIKRLKLFEIKVDRLLNQLCFMIKENKSNYCLFPEYQLFNRLNNRNNPETDSQISHLKDLNRLTEQYSINFIYNLDNSLLSLIDIRTDTIERFIEEKTLVGKSRNLGLQNGLAGLGMLILSSELLTPTEK